MLTSCINPALTSLTDKEQKMVDSLKAKCDCDVRVEKDVQVIENNKDSGRLFIKLNYNHSKTNFCTSDSLTLLNEAKQISNDFQTVMDKKEQYNEIAIKFYTSDKSVERLEKPTCEEIFVFSTKDNKFVEYQKLGQKSLRLK